MLEAKKEGIGRKLWKGTVTSLTAITFAIALSRGLHAEDIYKKNSKVETPKPAAMAVAQIPGETPINPSMNLPVVQPIQGEKKEEKKLEVVRATVTWYYPGDGKYYQISAETNDNQDTIVTYVNGKDPKPIHITKDINEYFNGKFEKRQILMSDKPTILIYGITGNGYYGYVEISEFIYDKGLATSGEIKCKVSELEKKGLTFHAYFDKNRREYILQIKNSEILYETSMDEKGRDTGEQDFGLYKLLSMR
jgi:hypothetical protein